MEASELIAGLRGSLDSSAALIARLESDLEAKTSEPRRAVPPALQLAAKKEGVNAELSQLLADAPAEKAAGDAGSASHNMVAILQAQRDRYKEKLAAAEGELMGAQKQVAALTLDKERLQKDNVELYGKIKYLQTFGRTSAKASESAAWDEEFSLGGGAEVISSIRRVASESVEIKYKNIYESKINPFAQFSNLEKQRKLGELSAADRLVLNTVTACVSSPAGRSFILVYIGVMHILVFATLYFVAHRTHHDCPPCSHAAASLANALLSKGAATPS